MKKKLLNISMALVAFAMLGSSCSNDTPSESNSNSVTPTPDVSDKPSEEATYPEYDYRLEKGEKYQKTKVEERTLNKLQENTEIAIEGIKELYLNPFDSSYFYGDASMSYPTASLLNGKNILYTSAWYSQKTFKREDECVEYVLVNDMGEWYVSEVSNTSETFIPFNGAVLSMSKNDSFKLAVNDAIFFSKGSIPTYAIGLYNEKGNRMVVSNANVSDWDNKQANFYDTNYLSYVTPSRFDNVGSINFVYDEDNKCYYVDKFRKIDEAGKIYTNVFNGFVVAASLSGTIENCQIHEGMRFNLHDKIYVEENLGVYSKSHQLNMNQWNTLYRADGKPLKFKVQKSTSAMADPNRRWSFEALVNKNNIIVDYNDSTDMKNGDYRLQIIGEPGIEGAILAVFEYIFTKGSRVSISRDNLYINSSIQQRLKNMYDIVNDEIEEAKKDLKHFNYSYNYEGIEALEKELVSIKEEMDLNRVEKNSTLDYRNYSLLGSLNQLSYKLYSYCNRNEASEVKATWYINYFNSQDKTMESIRDHLNIIKDAGFNELILNVISDGQVFYNNSKYFQMDYDVKKNNYGEFGNDFVKFITSEAHKLGMKVFATLCPFTNGIQYAFPDLKDCMALNIDGKDSVVTSQGKVSLIDPSNPKVQQRIKDTINDFITCNPEIDGIHLDYIRYGADNNARNTMMGITEAARVGFNKYSKDHNLGYEISSLDELRSRLRSENALFDRFNEFEQSMVTLNVSNIKDVCKEYDLPLTVAVADGYSYVKNWKSQDWASWAEKSIVDGIYLMDYYFGTYWIDHYFNDMLKNTKNNVLLVSGIDPSYAGLTADFFTKTVRGGTKNVNSNGYSIFGTHTQEAKKDGWDLLKDSNWEDSISPYDSLDKVMASSIDLLLKRCDDLYIKYNNQTLEQKNALKSDLDQIIELSKDVTIDSVNKILEKLEAMEKKTYANNEANNRIKEQIRYMHKLAKTRLNIIK